MPEHQPEPEIIELVHQPRDSIDLSEGRSKGLDTYVELKPEASQVISTALVQDQAEPIDDYSD